MLTDLHIQLDTQPADTAEFLYYHHYSDDSDWILPVKITKKTAKRIYFIDYHERVGFVDRERLIRDGGVLHRPSQRYLCVEKPLTDAEQVAAMRAENIARLRREMADAHPDRGGTSEEFRSAYARYQRAVKAMRPVSNVD